MKNIAILLTIILLSSVSSFAAEKRFTLATVDFPPYYASGLPENGWVSEVVRTALETQGYKVEIRFMPWAKAVKYTKQGYYDALLGAFYTEERAESYYFSAPISQARTGFFKWKENDISFKELTDLKNYKVGVVKGYATSKAFDAADYLNKVVVTSDDVGLKMLFNKSLDLFTGTQASIEYLLEQVLEEKEAGISEAVEFIKPVLAMNKMYVAISKKAVDADLKLIDFNQGLRTIYLDGTFRKVKMKHQKMLRKRAQQKKASAAMKKEEE
jgi:polar amino acid transport system substrate-binding protein